MTVLLGEGHDEEVDGAQGQADARRDDDGLHERAPTPGPAPERAAGFAAAGRTPATTGDSANARVPAHTSRALSATPAAGGAHRTTTPTSSGPETKRISSATPSRLYARCNSSLSSTTSPQTARIVGPRGGVQAPAAAAGAPSATDGAPGSQAAAAKAASRPA
ncbi:hypothetical protein SAV31267_066660 [Streptomyces avermitilis]|uniref:Uncharacterized protein n=1 Tax=Streptomyces avermitilis TaxID=33903 RepID=A0A4D4MYB6_STRAX|nr:hypothetical protein SAV31267_066660 [Streptomyces avermitilis]